MSNYNDSPENFKLIEAAKVAGVSIRNARLFSMLLSQLGIDNVFHEFILGLMASENWDLVDGMQEIPYKRMARKLSADDQGTFKRVYERLKKNKPEFFKWQEAQSFRFIETETTTYSTGSKKTHTLYSFPYYHVVVKLFNLPEDLPEKEIRLRVYQEAIKIMGQATPTKTRRRGRRKPEAIARSLRKLINVLVEDAGSLDSAAAYALEADLVSDEGLTIQQFVEAFIGNKGLRS